MAREAAFDVKAKKIEEEEMRTEIPIVIATDQRILVAAAPTRKILQDDIRAQVMTCKKSVRLELEVENSATIPKEHVWDSGTVVLQIYRSLKHTIGSNVTTRKAGKDELIEFTESPRKA
ncbi:hypothetical protein EYC84_008310 [Monilinia fructicola]|uniref:Uncharacterized protein n=1 Tax=Monilinia fructicola TaxID=38448 RepID=A0A5M9JGH6_MONFR|nr:hypothetical protein EYC84_008310 [Monilinia fructicola]